LYIFNFEIKIFYSSLKNRVTTNVAESFSHILTIAELKELIKMLYLVGLQVQVLLGTLDFP
jgi:hypothetical protein